jgi:ketosteroid isomerase-like protein
MRLTGLILCGWSLLCIGCSPKDAADHNITITNAMFDAFNQHDWQKMASFYSEEASFLDPSYGQEYVVKTRQEIVAKYAELEKILPDIHDAIVGIYPSGDKVTIEFISTGTISDTLKFKLPIVAVLTFKDGVIIKDATYYDQENP